jgi:tryptophan-rich sensory protein
MHLLKSNRLFLHIEEKMSALFGFNQAAAVVGWLAFLLVPISRHKSEDARVWYEAKREKLNMFWLPGPLFFPIFWALMYAVLTVACYYATFVIVADSWQFITGFTMIVTHILMLKLWEVVFWEFGSTGGAFLVFLGLFGTMAVILVCCIVGQPNLYLVPTLLFASYTFCLLFPAAINWVFAFPKGFSDMWPRHRSRSSRRNSPYGDLRTPLTPNK